MNEEQGSRQSNGCGRAQGFAMETHLTLQEHLHALPTEPRREMPRIPVTSPRNAKKSSWWGEMLAIFPKAPESLALLTAWGVRPHEPAPGASMLWKTCSRIGGEKSGGGGKEIRSRVGDPPPSSEQQVPAYQKV